MTLENLSKIGRLKPHSPARAEIQRLLAAADASLKDAVAYLDPSARQEDPRERLDDLGTDVEKRGWLTCCLNTRSLARVRVGKFAW